MAVCHSVVIDVDKKTGKNNMQASSPDELALVKGSEDAGYHFHEKTSEYISVQIEQTDEIEKFEVLAEFPFDSTRKRMSMHFRDM